MCASSPRFTTIVTRQPLYGYKSPSIDFVVLYGRGPAWHPPPPPKVSLDLSDHPSPKPDSFSLCLSFMFGSRLFTNASLLKSVVQ